MTKVIDTLTQEDFDGAFQKLLERYNKCIAAGGNYFEGDSSFMCVLSIKVPIRKSLETYLIILVDGTLTGPGSNGNETGHRILQSSRTGASSSDAILARWWEWGGLTFLQRCSSCILQSLPTGLRYIGRNIYPFFSGD